MADKKFQPPTLTVDKHEHGSASSRPLGKTRKLGVTKKLLAGLVTGMVALGFAPVSRASAATSYYNETPSFHCVPGQVLLDSIRIPTAELPARYYVAVDVWYGGNWHFYTYAQLPGGAQTAVISSGQQNENQVTMRANVPLGYYFTVVAVITSRTHSANAVQGQVDLSTRAYFGDSYCPA